MFSGSRQRTAGNRTKYVQMEGQRFPRRPASINGPEQHYSVAAETISRIMESGWHTIHAIDSERKRNVFL